MFAPTEQNRPSRDREVRREIERLQSQIQALQSQLSPPGEKDSPTVLQEARLPVGEMLNFVEDAVFAIDVEGRVIVWNSAMERLTGVAAETILGRDDHEYAKALTGEAQGMLVDVALGQADPEGQSYENFRREGDTVFAEKYFPNTFAGPGRLWGKASPLHDEKGEVIGAIESIRSIERYHKTLEQVQENEARYKALFEAANDAILLLKNGVFVECNSMAEELFRQPRETLTGHRPEGLSPAFQPDGEASAVKAIDKITWAIQNGSSIFEWQHLRGDNTTFDAEVSLSSFTFKGETYLHAVVRDVTARKREVREIAQSRAMLHTILNQSPAGILVIDANLQPLIANERLLSIFGTGGRNGDPGWTLYDTEGREFTAEDEAQSRRDVYAGKRHPEREFLLKRNDGIELWLRSEYTPVLDHSGTVLASLLMVIDITSLKEAEAAVRESELRYRRIVENSLASVIIFDQSGKVQFANVASRKLLKIGIDEEITETIFDYIHPDDRKLVEDRIKRRFRGEDVPPSYELHLIDREQNTHTVQLSVNMLKGPEGRATVLAFFIDVTEARRFEQEKQHAQALAEKTARMASIGVIAGGITHEINQPLNAILLHADTLRFMTEKGETHDPKILGIALDSILKSVQRINSIIQHMRQFWMASSTPKEIVLQQPVQRAIDLSAARIHAHEVDLDIQLPEESLVVNGDELQIEQITINLLSNATNALDNIKDRDRHITVKCHTREDSILLEVEDNGPGLPDLPFEQLTDPFFSTGRQKGGTGLGLAIVKMFAEYMHAKLDATNLPEGGTRFTVAFPANVRESDTDETTAG